MAWTAPATWTTGQNVSAADLNAQVRDNMLALSAWTSYTPSWTGTGGTPTVGNGTLTGMYLSYGSVVMVRIALTWGSTTSASGISEWKFTLPVAPTAGWILNGMIIDSGTTNYAAVLSDFSGSTGVLRADTSLATVSNTSPMTWTTGDQVVVNGIYSA